MSIRAGLTFGLLAACASTGLTQLPLDSTIKTQIGLPNFPSYTSGPSHGIRIAAHTLSFAQSDGTR